MPLHGTQNQQKYPAYTVYFRISVQGMHQSGPQTRHPRVVHLVIAR